MNEEFPLRSTVFRHVNPALVGLVGSAKVAAGGWLFRPDVVPTAMPSEIYIPRDEGTLKDVE